MCADTAPTGFLRQRQVLQHHLQQTAVVLDHILAGPRPGGGHIAGQGEGPAAQVHRVQRRPGLGQGVDQVADPAGVLELQVGRFVEVDVGLRRTVDGQQPGPLPVHVGHQFRGAVVDGAGHGYGLVHQAIVPV